MVGGAWQSVRALMYGQLPRQSLPLRSVPACGTGCRPQNKKFVGLQSKDFSTCFVRALSSSKLQKFCSLLVCLGQWLKHQLGVQKYPGGIVV